MLILLSPAKQFDFKIRLASRKQTEPRLKDHSIEVMRSLRKLSQPKLKRLMHISDDLATLNHQRHFNWRPDPEPAQTAAAISAFRGDAYLGLGAEHWDSKDLAWAQQHLRILSGLYGLLRPLDHIQPYRLEMGSGLRLGRAGSLKAYWKKHLNHLLAADVLASAKDKKRPLIMNLASAEYGGAVAPACMPAGTHFINVRFLRPNKKGALASPGFAVKRARGAMARFIIRNRTRTESAARQYAEDGYRFDGERSSANDWVFVAR